MQLCFTLCNEVSYKMFMNCGYAGMSCQRALFRPGWEFRRQALDSRQAGGTEFGSSTKARKNTAARRGLVNVSNALQMRAPCSGTKNGKAAHPGARPAAPATPWNGPDVEAAATQASCAVCGVQGTPGTARSRGTFRQGSMNVPAVGIAWLLQSFRSQTTSRFEGRRS